MRKTRTETRKEDFKKEKNEKNEEEEEDVKGGKE